MAPHGSCMAASSTGMGVCRRGSTPQKRSKLPYGLNWRGAGPLSIPVLSLVKVERGSAFRPQRLVFFFLSLSLFCTRNGPTNPCAGLLWRNRCVSWGCPCPHHIRLALAGCLSVFGLILARNVPDPGMSGWRKDGCQMSQKDIWPDAQPPREQGRASRAF